MIQLTGIQKLYSSGIGIVPALRHIDLQIGTGEFVAIVGESGSGKSALMNILGCLDTPTAGSYRLDGQDMNAASPRVRAGIRNRLIGFVFQGFNLAPRLTSLENVELPLLFRGIPRREREKLALSALEAVGLTARQRHFPAQLSGGQQQRVAIARAIAARPPLILADEPTGSLDRAAADACMELLSGLNREGHTVILITHDALCATAARRRITLRDGQITEDSAG